MEIRILIIFLLLTLGSAITLYFIRRNGVGYKKKVKNGEDFEFLD